MLESQLSRSCGFLTSSSKSTPPCLMGSFPSHLYPNVVIKLCSKKQALGIMVGSELVLVKVVRSMTARCLCVLYEVTLHSPTIAKRLCTALFNRTSTTTTSFRSSTEGAVKYWKTWMSKAEGTETSRAH